MRVGGLEIDGGTVVDVDNIPDTPLASTTAKTKVSTNGAITYQKYPPTPTATTTTSSPAKKQPPVDELGNSRHSTSSSATAASKKKIPSATFKELFQFAETKDIVTFGFGIFFSIISSASMPAINVVFGDVINAIAEPINVKELVNTAVTAMSILGVYGFVTFYLSFWLCGTAAANIANGWRLQYLEHLLIQDMQFFDTAESGSLTLMLSDSAMAIQTGLSEKFAQGIQGFFQFVFGFGLAFYFGPIMTLVLLACVPVLGLVTTAMFMWGSEDGIFGKEAYESASTIANEAMSNVRTVASLNAEPMMSRRYDAKLGDSETAAIRQGSRNAILTGLLFGVIFVMYGFGFWFGSTLIAKSVDDAIEQHPAPVNLLDPREDWYYAAVLGCGEWIEGYNTGENPEPFEVCVCGLPWEYVPNATGPNCGCGYSDGGSGGLEDTGVSTLSGCVSGGQVMMVFFSILIGSFSVGQIGPGVSAMNEAKQAAGKLLFVINRTPTIGGEEGETDGDMTAKTLEKNNNTKNKKPKVRLKRENVRGELVLDNMHFKYTRAKDVTFASPPSDDKDKDKNDEDTVPEEKEESESLGVVFGGCNLTMKAGETVALVGESGCGKSTIAKLVQRFYDPTEGRILLDGVDLKDINVKDLRSCIGVVSQEPLLFDTTIEENIKFGKPDATFEEIVHAAESANAHDFIMSFPDGYQTLVGPKGGKLSGGQKQRVAIARAIVRNCPILILDEATSALDNKSEKLVQQALDKLIQHEGEGAERSRTIIVIAHRLSTVRNADKIVVLGSPDGTSTAMTGSVILEQGTHDELVQREKGFYRALVGSGAKGSGLVDDTYASTDDNDATGSDAASLKLKVDAASEKSHSKGGDLEKDGGNTGFSLFGGKKDPKQAEKEAEEKKRLAANKARVWTYTRPEIPWIVFGASNSIIKGTIFPLLSIVFSKMIVVWYNPDTEYMVQRSLEYSLIFYGLAVLSFVTEAIQKSVFEMIGERLTKRLRGDLFRGILRQDVSWFEDDKNAVGILASRLSTDVKLVRLVAGQSVAATVETASAITTGCIIAGLASWEMFLVMLCMVPALGFAEALQFTAMKGSEGSIREELNASTEKLHETITGIREVQSFSLQRIVIIDVEKRIHDTISPASRKAAVMKGITMGLIQLIQFLVYAFAFWIGGIMIDSGRITFEDFNQALWAMAFAASGLGQAALFAGDAAKASAAANSIFSTLDNVPVIDTAPWENNGCADMKTSEATVRQIPNSTLKEGKAELSKVNFAYPTRKSAKVFDQIDLQIPSGKVVALVGSSGSGKSTVVQLIERFYDPASYKEEAEGDGLAEVVVDNSELKEDNGAVKIDDEDIRKQDVRWLRSNMGYVGQEPVLFNDTIYNNIAMGKENCTKEEVEHAARQANAYDFIMGLEEGFKTMVGIGGGRISGGQKQRVAIARALMGQPRILIFDEATSALDNESEKIVQASLDKLVKESGGQRTTIIIAHRLSTIQNADTICVLENNGDGSRVVEMGSHDELLALGQKYKALVQAYEKN
ncbi:Leptomycin B resistance protein pmd1 [Seminavis robusta]|uniref:Leptomycin B resistance protein pmd1 n=1 Tax=Seminavis robusta TaxID=568900 RepID=A0A9N8EP42_9STRA|nr:Leptomycin B resistance protein pmd1 [Seminavis robusta]|eukprot:Sro1567_g282990.1 Leptomycin B resistance protein pmd1 (1529) ;mRNA; r:13860-19043